MEEKKKIRCSYGILVIVLFAALAFVTDYTFIERKTRRCDCPKCETTNNVVTNDNVSDDSGVLSVENALFLGSLMYEKVDSFYANTLSTTKSFCGETFNDHNKYFDGILYNQSRYFSSVQDVKNYLSTFLGNEMVERTVTSFRYKDDDGKLYCLAQAGDGGYRSRYTGNKEFSIVENSKNRIVYNVNYIFYKDYNVEFDYFDKVPVNISMYSDEDLIKVSADFIIEKGDSNNWIVTKYAHYSGIDIDSEEVKINYK